MKKTLFVALLLAVPTFAHAAVSVESTTNPTDLVNRGYSTQVADMVTVSKARNNSQAYYTEDEQTFKNQSKFTKFWRKLYVYADPAAEDYSFYHHDTDTTPSYTDL
jgi:hypothetical protein